MPTIANGYIFDLFCTVAQTFSFTSSEGANIVGQNNAVGNTVSVNTIGGGLRIFSNPAANKWYVENTSAGSNTVSIS